ncbi:MAG: MBL fold metallo-hydrolase [Phycisphaerales bacterium]
MAHPRSPHNLLHIMAKAARSQIRRYPAHVAESLRVAARGAKDQPEAAQPPVAPLERVPLGAQWLGHASVLLSVGGRLVLTDPVFSNRVGPRIGRRTLGVARLAPPPLVAPLSPDLVLISHAHFDHLDRPSLESIANPLTMVVTAKGTRRLIPRGFASVHELDWNEELTLDGLCIRAIRPRHWGARTLVDRHRGYNAYLIERAGQRVLFAGDTAATDAFNGLAADLAIFGIGAYEPWIHAHANPEEVWAMFSACRPMRSCRSTTPLTHSVMSRPANHSNAC